MYFLYVFGDKVEEKLGGLTYLCVYFASGFGAAYLQYSVDPHSVSLATWIGASGRHFEGSAPSIC